MNKNLDNIFFYISKLVVIIPLFILLIALMIRFNIRQDIFSQKLISVTLTPTFTQNINNLSVNNNSSSEAKIDLKGPLICNFNYNESSISAYIKDKKIALNNINKKGNTHIIVSGDCYYQWLQGMYTGEKTCGVSQLLSMVDIANQFNFFSLEDLIKYIPLFNNEKLSTSDEAVIKKAVNTCEKTDFDNIIFSLPKTVIFKNTPRISPTITK